MEIAISIQGGKTTSYGYTVNFICNRLVVKIITLPLTI